MLNILVGDAKAGQAYFAAKCTACHTGAAMQGIATRVSDPMALQNLWVGGGRGGGGRGGAAPSVVDGNGHRRVRPEDRRPPRAPRRLHRRRGPGRRHVAIVPPRRRRAQGRGQRSAGGAQKLLPTYTDKDIHDVTAYLVTLK